MIDLTIKNTDRRFSMIVHLMEKKDLESLHTKTLIKMLRYETKCYGGDYDTCEQIYDNGYNMLQFRLTEYGGYTREQVQKYKSYIEVKSWKYTSVLEYTYADEETIRDILNTRPHIPNKKERKETTRLAIVESIGKTKRKLKFSSK